MTEEKEIVVTSIEGLYDEKIVEKLEQGICWFGKHRFVNYYKHVDLAPHGGYLVELFRICRRKRKNDCCKRLRL